MITEEQYQAALKIVEEYEHEQMLLNEPDDEDYSEPEECDGCGRMDCVCYFAQDCKCGAWIMSNQGRMIHVADCIC